MVSPPTHARTHAMRARTYACTHARTHACMHAHMHACTNAQRSAMGTLSPCHPSFRLSPCHPSIALSSRHIHRLPSPNCGHQPLNLRPSCFDPQPSMPTLDLNTRWVFAVFTSLGWSVLLGTMQSAQRCASGAYTTSVSNPPSCQPILPPCTTPHPLHLALCLAGHSSSRSLPSPPRGLVT